MKKVISRYKGDTMIPAKQDMPFSKEALDSLATTLQIHKSFLWVDPVSNHFTVKRINQPLEEEQQPFSSGQT